MRLLSEYSLYSSAVQCFDCWILMYSGVPPTTAKAAWPVGQLLHKLLDLLLNSALLSNPSLISHPQNRNTDQARAITLWLAQFCLFMQLLPWLLTDTVIVHRGELLHSFTEFAKSMRSSPEIVTRSWAVDIQFDPRDPCIRGSWSSKRRVKFDGDALTMIFSPIQNQKFGFLFDWQISTDQLRCYSQALC